MTALILGLVTASAKSSFDEVTFAVESGARDVLTLDRLLARYGPETSEIRAAFKDAVARRIDMIWPQGSSRPSATRSVEAFVGCRRTCGATSGSDSAR